MGILSSKTIRSKNLVDPFSDDRLQKTSYELGVGKECWQGRKKKTLKKDQIIHIKAHEVVTVSTWETISTPKNIVAHFDLRRRWALRGLIMQCGTQIEPNYKGPLACILYNLSDQEIDIKCGEALFAIEFSTVERNDEKLTDKHKEYSHLWSMVPQGITSAMTKLQQDVSKAVKLTMRILPLVLFTLSIIVGIIASMIAFDTWFRPKESIIGWQIYEDLRISLTKSISENISEDLLNDLKLFVEQEIQRQITQSKKGGSR